MTQFKVGDRVAVYSNHDVRQTGAVIGFSDSRVLMSVKLETKKAIDGYPDIWWVHPKQCRRLVKKERRRVWLREHDLKYKAPPAIGYNEPADLSEWAEFIEVRKKK